MPSKLEVQASGPEQRQPELELGLVWQARGPARPEQLEARPPLDRPRPPNFAVVVACYL